jgi:cytochrome c556
MSRFVLAAVIVCAALGSAWALDDNDEKEERPTSFWMQKKLEYSQKILGALATEDFATLRQSSTSMERLSRIEGFVRRSDVKNYRTQLGVFEFANQELGKMAAQKNLDGAALAFTQMTLSCVNCHKLIRGPGIADAP